MVTDVEADRLGLDARVLMGAFTALTLLAFVALVPGAGRTDENHAAADGQRCAEAIARLTTLELRTLGPRARRASLEDVDGAASFGGAGCTDRQQVAIDGERGAEAIHIAHARGRHGRRLGPSLRSAAEDVDASALAGGDR